MKNRIGLVVGLVITILGAISISYFPFNIFLAILGGVIAGYFYGAIREKKINK